MRSLRKRFLIRAPRNKGTATGSPFSYSQPQSQSSAPAIRRDGAIALHRMAAHCYARQLTQSKFRAAMRPISWTTPGTELPRPPFRCTSPMCQRKRKMRGSQEGDKKPYWCLIPLLFSPGTRLPRPSPPPDGGAYSFSSAEEASAACDAFFVLFPGLPITLSMYAGTS